ncbi:DNA-processing protein DprA [Corynebacterium pseudodiphtheriticum]|uniref:DNA-processing protein DprA n=1 Tax=Corynebacterium pseudodiphtheriticum TaxID=37637 RepID=UPI002542F279|nr:DNA-processing protein DprA [Corynebacterium pseudodiphtheriticum]MDK4327885.1 DNA-processing protein DprA [Corynebacterium pseudodiphtheriticum]
MNQHDDSIVRTAQVLRLVHADLDISQTERIDRLVSAGDPLAVLREQGVVGSRPDFSAEIAAISDWRAQGFGITDVLDEDYPALLSEVREAPGVIYWQGSLRPAEMGVCIVGSRDATSSVLDETYKLAGLLAIRNVPVISGLARGIDTAAHQGAVDAHGRTIAVMGTGLERTYPPANTQLRQRIQQGEGLVLTQFAPGAKVAKWNFPMRNAVMSGYGAATLVMAAGEKSGTKHQAQAAVKHGRRVIFPESVVDSVSWAHEMVAKGKARSVVSISEACDALVQAIDDHQSEMTLF